MPFDPTTPPYVAIIIVNWNGKNDTVSLLKSMDVIKTPHQILVVDNGSSDDSVATIKNEFPYVEVIESPHNLGYAGGNNLGIRVALRRAFSHILLLNNDTLISSDIVEELLSAESLLRNKALISPLVLQTRNPDLLDHVGGRWNQHRLHMDLIGKNEPHELWKDRSITSVEYAYGCCLFAHREVFEKVGLFDERFFLFFEEADLCYRASQIGIKSYVYPHSVIRHKGGSSFSGKPHTSYFFFRNRLLWMKKHNAFTARALFLLTKESIKLIRHLLLLSIKKKLAPKEKHYKIAIEAATKYAALQGTVDYLCSRFGNVPQRVIGKID